MTDTSTSSPTPQQQKIFERLAKRFEGKIFDSVKSEQTPAVTTFLEHAFGKDSLQKKTEFSEWIRDESINNIQLIAWDKDEVIGCQTGLSCSLNSPYGTEKAAWAIDLSVRDDWKMKGLGVALIKKLMDQKKIVMGLGISSAAQVMFKRLGWKEMGQVSCYIKPLSTNGFSNLKQESFMYSRFIYPIIAFTIKSLTKLRLNFTQDYSVKTITNFKAHQQELEHFITTTNKTSSFFEEKKDIDQLQWRFCDHSFTPNSYMINLIYLEGKLEGYMVTKVAVWKEKKVLAISDFIGPEACYKTIIKTCEQQAIKSEVDAIFYQGINPVFEILLTKSLFIKRPHGDLFMLYCDNDLAQSTEILNRNSWRITLSNADMDFMFF